MSDETTPPPSPAAPDRPATAAAGAPPAPTTLGDTVRGLAIAASVGAAAIHFSLAPTHFDETASHGIFFLVVAWAQLAVAAALARWRQRLEPWLAALAVSGGVALVWLGSRTIGVPESHHDGVGFPDALATGLEVVVVLATLVTLRPRLADRTVPRVHPLTAGVGTLALVAAVSASVTPSLGGETAGHTHADAAAAGGHHHGGAQTVAAVDPDDRCDLGFNTVGYNAVARPGAAHAHSADEPVDFTLEQWANVFVDPADGMTPEAVVSFLEDRPAMRDGILSGSLTHTLSPDPWIPMTDQAECEQLADELRQARSITARYPTVADAEAAGYRKVTQYYPGIAAHYINEAYIDREFDLDHPEMLLYDGTGPEANMVGLSYYVLREGDEEPTAGFTGPNDHYHRHIGLCFVDGVVASGSNTSEEECAAQGGDKGGGLGGWMNHVWVVPGCESAWGVFSGANPTLTVQGLDPAGGGPTGCGTGRALDDPLAFDPAGDGPRIDSGRA